MPTIYLETSIICHLTDPLSPNPITRACQQLTQLWWHTRSDPSNTFVSDFVHQEIKSGDPLRAMHRIATIQHLVSLQDNEEIRCMKELLISGGGLIAKAHWAAFHIACATHSHCEVLMTWNCTDIANAEKMRLLKMLINDGEYLLPELVTPFELLENSYETLWRRNSS
ncbi:hypothetical protein [Duganella sp.]|uniref:hypothetical protein n=1 Tax=Duganella sp. TaxID=1904440 RepID=UPI0031D0C25C